MENNVNQGCTMRLLLRKRKKEMTDYLWVTWIIGQEFTQTMGYSE